MIQSSVVSTRLRDAKEAGRELASQLNQGLSGPADAVILFASPQYDQPALLKALKEGSGARFLVGSSSAGEFTSQTNGVGLACALAIRSDELQFSASVGRNLSADGPAAAGQIVAGFKGLTGRSHPHRSALVMTDALAGHAEELVAQLTQRTGGTYQFAGGGAGDDAQFQKTAVFFGTEAITDAAVALEILSHKPIGIGVGHGWQPTGKPLRVTEARGKRVFSLNGAPAVEAFEAHAEGTRQKLDRAAPIPFFLHNILGIDTGIGHRLRVPLAIGEDGSVLCASEIPAGATVQIMQTNSKSAVAAATRAAEAAITRLKGASPGVAVFFDCVATRLRMGEEFGFELNAVSDTLGGAGFVGCNTHGQIARADGQFSGFHNCTAVVCVLPA